MGIAATVLVASAPLAAQDTWEPLTTGTTEDLFTVHFVSEDVGYVAGNEGTILKTTDGGQTWEDVAPPSLDRDVFGLYFFDADTGIAVGRLGNIVRTTNGGATWDPIPSGVGVSLSSVSFAGDVGLIGGEEQTILRSEDRGATWTVVQTGFFGGGFFGTDMVDDAVGFVAGQNSIVQPLVAYTADGGATFGFTAFYLDGNEGYLEDVDFLDAQTGITAGVTFDFQGAISRSVDGGQTWTTMLFPDPLRGVGFADEQVGYAVGVDGALLKTTDGGQTWTSETSVTTAILHEVVLPTPMTGYAVGSGGTVLKGTITMGTASEGDAGPSPFALEPNAPNPFRARTALRYRLPEGAHVTLRVYDALGQEVAVLVDGPRAPGRHEVEFDGSRLSAGTYLCVLEAGGSKATRTMLLLK